MIANNIPNEPYWVLLSCHQSFCHTLQMMDISLGNETLQSLITLCNSANKVIFIFLSLSPFLCWLRATQASATPLDRAGPGMRRPLQLWQRAGAQPGKRPDSRIAQRQTERGGGGGWASKRQTETRRSRGGGQAAAQRQTISGRARRQRRWRLPPPRPHTG